MLWPSSCANTYEQSKPQQPAMDEYMIARLLLVKVPGFGTHATPEPENWPPPCRLLPLERIITMSAPNWVRRASTPPNTAELKLPALKLAGVICARPSSGSSPSV